MDSAYRTFSNWENIDPEEYLFQASADREIDDPGLNQDDSREQQQEDFDDSDDFHKNDDTDEEKKDTSTIDRSGRFDGTISI